MHIFTSQELAYLQQERRLARLATVGADGTPHVVPIGMWHFDEATGAIEISGHALDRTKKYRDVQRTGRAALVVDDLASIDPWRPRGIEVRGRGEVVADPEPHIRIRPERVVSWGIESDVMGEQNARSVS